MTKKQPICLHFHIFKNAGTTIDWTLKKSFGKNHLTMDYEVTNPAQIFSWEEVLNFLKKYPDVKAFSSHIIRFPIPEDTPFNFLPMVFIRHPIDRAFSIYSFKRRDSDNALATIVAKTGTKKEFIEWSLRIKKYAVMKNFQVLYLSRTNLKPLPITEKDLSLAKEILEKCIIAGVVERLDESLVLAEENLRPFFEKINLAYKKQNISLDRQGSFDERIENEKKEIGETLYDKLIEHNKFDLELHKTANELLDYKIKQIHNFEEKLSDFQNRCQKLSHLFSL